MYNVTETSKLLGVGKAKVYELINKGYILAMDLGGIKISDAEINKFVDCYTGYSFKDINNVTKLNF